MRRGFLGGPGGKGIVSERVKTLRKKVEDAEAELRQRREERLKFEASRPADGEEDREFAFFSASSERQRPATGEPSLCDDALAALASHKEPPPEVLHRLGQALMLLFNSSLLCELGDHPIPKKTSWGNLQLLLKKPADSHPSGKAIKEVLAQAPHGVRLAKYVREEVLCEGSASAALTRAAIEQVDERCVPLLDYVSWLAQEGDGARSKAPKPKKKPKAEPLSPEEQAQFAELRERTMEAVAEQEREVSKLRKELREAERSDAASRRFAEENAPNAAPQESSSAVASNAAVSDAQAKMKEASGYPSTEALRPQEAPRPNEEPKPKARSAAERQDEALPTGEEREVKRMELQYRLFETGVSELTTTPLEGMLLMLQDPRATGVRKVEIVGYYEKREEPEVADQRADAVHEWFVGRDVVRSRLRIAKATDTLGKRAVMLRLLDTVGLTEDSRSRAQGLLTKIGVLSQDGSVAPGFAAEAATAVPVAAAAAASAADAAAPSAVIDEAVVTEEAPAVSGRPRPRVQVEESADEGGRQQLRLVFSAPDGSASLSARDTALEFGSSVVRLASLSDSWPELEVPLPFAVHEPAAGAAKFSKKAGTLTVTLSALA